MKKREPKQPLPTNTLYSFITARQCRVLPSPQPSPDKSPHKATDEPLSTPSAITCVIFNTVGGSCGYNYADEVAPTKAIGDFTYRGQKMGALDNLIIPNETLYVEREKATQPFIYRGLIIGKQTLKENDGGGTAYALTLNPRYMHNQIASGAQLDLLPDVPRGPGSCCLKRSVIKHLGLEHRGNIMAGIVKVD